MANYKSNYTGAEIDGTVTKLIDIPQEPTEEHIGKVIGVVEGESEAKGANPKYGLVPMSGGEPLIITSSDSTTFRGATYSEIVNAIEAGRTVIFIDPDEIVTRLQVGIASIQGQAIEIYSENNKIQVYSVALKRDGTYETKNGILTLS